MAPLPRLAQLLPWPAPATPEGQAFFRTADEIADAFLALGAHKTLMLAMLGAAEVSSHLKPDLGLWGWRGRPHHDDLDEERVEVDDSVAGQVKMAWSALTSPGGGFQHVASAVHAQDAGHVVGDFFMRSGDGEKIGLSAARWERDWQFSGW